MVLPFKTESYASQADPEDNTEIPHCTLKMFPEETLHCVEWAKDLFGQKFTLGPQGVNKVLISEDDPYILDPIEKTAIKKAINTIKKKPIIFDDCIKWARKRFQKHFHNDILQLLHVYPLDKQTKEGRPFWSLPKRPPTPFEFDPENEGHAGVIAAWACLLGNMYGVKIPYENTRSKEAKLEMAQKAATYEQKPFVPND